MDQRSEPATLGVQASPGFALGQLLKAEATRESHPDDATRERAETRVNQWRRVLAGMLSGALDIGSRTPIAGVPPWVTPEVVHGGFATGDLPAGGPLQPHEHAWLERLELPERDRAALAAHLLGADGFAELAEMLDSGRYGVTLPEEAALLACVWLVRAGAREAAEALLAEIAPFMGRLRFHPVPTSRAFATERALCLQTVGEAIRRLEAIAPNARITRQRETVQAWLPLYDRLVRCFVETLDGPAPALRLDDDGRAARDEAGRLQIAGGWPCRVFPAGWRAEAEAILAEHARLRQAIAVGTRFRHPNGNFARLITALEDVVCDRLTEGRMRQVRHILAEIGARRGLPDSERCRALRAHQAAIVAWPDVQELAKVIVDRLDDREREEGLASLDGLLDPVTADEGRRFRVLPGAVPYPSLAAIVRHSLTGSLAELVARGQVSSCEVLARLIPAVTAAALIAPIEDPALRRLHAATYQAFRRRRSVLLLNYQKQVQFEELPWIRALLPHLAQARVPLAARETLREVTWTAINAFPETLLPNPLVRELSTLVDAAGLDVPLVEELAADIFMGGFTRKFLVAAQCTSRFLAGTLYARYYDLPVERLAGMGTGRGESSPAAAPFSALCAERAGPPVPGASPVAANGTVIEQCQILTSHNLAPLVSALDLAEPLTGVAEALAKRCFDYGVARLRPAASPWRHRLHALKNAAYAWRQMVFWLSLLPEPEQTRFAGWMRERLGRERAAFQARYMPAVRGLEDAIARVPPSEPRAAPFLGWTTGRHWFLDDWRGRSARRPRASTNARVPTPARRVGSQTWPSRLRSPLASSSTSCSRSPPCARSSSGARPASASPPSSASSPTPSACPASPCSAASSPPRT